MTDLDNESPNTEGSFEPELQEQAVGKPQDEQDELDACYKKLCDDAENIKILERLSGRGPKLADDAVEILTTPQTNRDSKLYQLFLHDILRLSGRELVVLVSGLGKQRVTHLSEKERTILVGRVKDTKDAFYSSGLASLAEEYQVPSANDSRLAQIAGGSRKRAREEEQQLPRKRNTPDLEAGEPGRLLVRSVSDLESQWGVQAKGMKDRMTAKRSMLMEPDLETERPLRPTGMPALYEMLSCVDSFAGRVFRLTNMDAITILASDQVRGGVWLTDPYVDALPFITISISEEMSRQLATRCPQEM